MDEAGKSRKKSMLNDSDSLIQIFNFSDKLLSPEFEPVLEALISKCAPEKQILLFSATFPVTVRGFKEKHLPRAHIINVGFRFQKIFRFVIYFPYFPTQLMEELTLRGITQFYAFVDERQKVSVFSFLFRVLSSHPSCILSMS